MIQKTSKQLGQTDRHKLDQYLDVIEIEQRIARPKTRQLVFDFKKPSGIPSSHKEHLRLMYDIMPWPVGQHPHPHLLQGHDGSNRSFNEVGVREGHHSLITIGEIK